MRVGTDVFAGLITVNGFHVLVGPKARGTSDPRKHLCLDSIHLAIHRVDGTSAWRAARRLDGPHSRCLRRSSTWEVTQYIMYQRSHVYLLGDEKFQ